MPWWKFNKDTAANALVEITTLVSAGVFAGGAIIISIAEHRARLKLGRRSLLIQWKESYDRAAPWQVI